MSKFLGLPDTCITTIIATWLQVVDVGRTDSAFCNREKQFLRSISIQIVYETVEWLNARCNDNKSDDLCNRMASWAMMRGLRVNGLYIGSSVESCPIRRQNYLAAHGNSVTHLIYSTQVEQSPALKSALTDLFKYCPSVQCVSQTSHFRTSEYVHVANSWSHLTAMKFGAKANDECILVVARMCRKLQEITHGSYKSGITEKGWIAFFNNAPPELKSVSLMDGLEGTGAYLAIAHNCSQLRSLQGCLYDITDAALVVMAEKCPHLEELDCGYSSGVTDVGMEAIAQAGLLTTLYMEHDTEITEASVIAVARCCPHLRHLCVRKGDAMIDAALTALGLHAHNLEYLSIDVSEDATDEGWLALAQGCALLHTLCLGYTGGSLTCNALTAVAQACPKLECISLPDDMEDIGLLGVATHCPLLKEVVLSHHSIVSDASLVALAQHCPQLAKLEADHCRGLTDTTLAALAQHCPGLLSISVDETGFTLAGLAALAAQCLNLQEITVSKELVGGKTLPEGLIPLRVAVVYIQGNFCKKVNVNAPSLQ